VHSVGQLCSINECTVRTLRYFYISLVTNFMAIRAMVAEFTHTHTQTDRHDDADRSPLRFKADAPKTLKIAEVRFKQTNQVVKNL
jgi:hypothetical protein